MNSKYKWYLFRRLFILTKCYRCEMCDWIYDPRKTVWSGIDEFACNGVYRTYNQLKPSKTWGYFCPCFQPRKMK